MRVEAGSEFDGRSRGRRVKCGIVSGVVGKVKEAALTPCWRRLGYLARFQRFHALLVGTVTEALARNRQAPQHERYTELL